MRKGIALLCALVLLFAASAASAYEIEPYREPEAGRITVTETFWLQEDSGWIGVVAFTLDGEEYELCVAGLGEKLTREETAALLAGWLRGEAVTLTGDLIDAEKMSHLVPNRTGRESAWVVQDEIRQQGMWGDGLLCWAASTSNMLWMTGWAAKTADPDTGKAFGSEDEVFSYFTRHMANDGGYQHDGIRWFLSGGPVELQTREEDSGALLPGVPFRTEVSRFTAGQEPDPDFLAHSADIFRMLRDGGAVGLTVDTCYPNYPLKADPNTTVTPENGKYTAMDWFTLEADDPRIEVCDFTFGEEGEIVLLTKDGEKYLDAAGREWPALCVKHDRVYRDGDSLWMADENEITGELEVTVITEYPADEVDLTAGTCELLCGNGLHAVTAPGYIMKLTGDDPGVRALFIADSDNDANIWAITEDTVRKEDRPDRYLLCPVEIVEVMDSGRTYNLHGYQEGAATLVAYVAGLEPPAE